MSAATQESLFFIKFLARGLLPENQGKGAAVLHGLRAARDVDGAREWATHGRRRAQPGLACARAEQRESGARHRLSELVANST